MMIRVYLAVMLLLIFSLADVHAEVYTWTDEQGTVNFTDDFSSIPIKFRKQSQKLGEPEPSPASKESTPKSPHESPQAVSGAVTGESAQAGISAGKSYDQWKKDLEDREAALSALKGRMDEIAYRLKNVPARKEEQETLVEEHKALFNRFNELKAQYNQQVEKARKDGVSVTIQQ